MYWSAQPSGGNDGSRGYSNKYSDIDIGIIVERGPDALDDLLEVENLILKTRNGNEVILQYLRKESVLKKLFEYSMAIGLSGEDARRYPLIVCELLCCEQRPIIGPNRQNVEMLLAPLWKFLNVPKGALSVPLAVCWSRIIHFFMQNHSDSLILSMPANSAAMLCDHIEVPVVREAIFTLITHPYNNALMILEKQGFFRLLLGGFSKGADRDSQESCSLFITDLLEHPCEDDYNPSNLIKIIVNFVTQPSFLNEDAASLISENNHPLYNFKLDVLDHLCTFVSKHKIDHSVKKTFLDYCASKMEFFSKILQIQPVPLSNAQSNKFYDPSKQGTDGDLDYNLPANTPLKLGVFRYFTARLFSFFPLLNEEMINENIVEYKITNKLLDLFFKFKENNLLHSVVETFLRNILVETTSTASFSLHAKESLLLDLFLDCRITERIVAAQRLNDSALMQVKGNSLPFMGHLTVIVDHIQSFIRNTLSTPAESDDASAHNSASQNLKTKLNHIFEDSTWKEFIDGSFRETKIRNNLVLGASNSSHPAISSDEDTQTDIPSNTLNFNSYFACNSDEQLARFFCQQVIGNLPTDFAFDDDEDGDESEDLADTNEYILDESQLAIDSKPGIIIPVLTNGIDSFLEMEMKFSSIIDLDASSQGGGEGGDSDTSNNCESVFSDENDDSPLKLVRVNSIDGDDDEQDDEVSLEADDNASSSSDQEGDDDQDYDDDDTVDICIDGLDIKK